MPSMAAPSDAQPIGYEPIQTLEVENYGCIKKAKFALTPLHALIGPNDSGKSTALRAIRVATQLGAGVFERVGQKLTRPFDPMLDVTPARRDSTLIALRYPDGLAYAVRTASGGVQDLALHGPVARVAQSEGSRSLDVPGLLARSTLGPEAPRVDRIEALKVDSAVDRLRSRVTLATMVRLDPDRLRVASELIPEGRGIGFLEERGQGLAGVFDAIMNRDADAFAEIQRDLRRLFPTVSKLGLINVSNNMKEVAVTLTDGSRVGAAAMSEGLLYYLGFVALKHLESSRLYLVEEPENGLHPARIADVMAVLREISKTGQVVIATHSPLVVNELEGHEVSVVTRDPVEGTQVTLLKDVPGYDDAMKVYKPGEFWVSYADGAREEPLLSGHART